MYLFDAQNRWGYELVRKCQSSPEFTCIYSMLRIVGVMRSEEEALDVNEYIVYLFDAQNRWGYETYGKPHNVLCNTVYLFDAQNRWGYETTV